MLRGSKFTIAFIGWMVFITFSSLSSFQDTDTPKIDIPHLDKVVHFIFYFVAAVLAIFFVRERTEGDFPFHKALWVSVIGAIVFGILIEVLQYALTENREGDPWDALANSFGAIVGTLAVKFFFSGEWRLKWKN